jgi:ribosomal protein S18 acetylase RimI-like enzyme
VISVEVPTEVDLDLVAAFARLIPQLSSSAPAPDADQLAEIIAAPATTVLIARDDSEQIVGTTTLVLFRIPTGVRAWIEDVVVDEAAGGKGVGKALTQEALRIAKEHGAKTLELTSRSSREIANHMYKKLGFQARDTNVYRFDFEA